VEDFVNQVKLIPADIFDKIMPERLKRQPGSVRKVNAVFLFDLSGPDGGQWTLDCTKTSDWITRGRTSMPRVVLRMSDETFVQIHKKELSPQVAAMTGRVKFKPMDLGIAQKLLFILQ
jgi:putative sterol carrier protein